MTEERRDKCHYSQTLLNEDWAKVADKYGEDFSEHTQSEFRREWAVCEKAPFFQICLMNAMAINPVLNRSKVIRELVLDWSH